MRLHGKKYLQNKQSYLDLATTRKVLKAQAQRYSNKILIKKTAPAKC